MPSITAIWTGPGAAESHFPLTAPEEQVSKTGLDRRRGANHICDAPRGPREDREPGVVNFSRTGPEL